MEEENSLEIAEELFICGKRTQNYELMLKTVTFFSRKMCSRVFGTGLGKPTQELLRNPLKEGNVPWMLTYPLGCLMKLWDGEYPTNMETENNDPR